MLHPVIFFQVCSILWSEEHKEFISGHGFSQNQLTIWKYPSMKKVTDLMGECMHSFVSKYTKNHEQMTLLTLS